MAVTSGAMMAIFTVSASRGQHLKGQVAWRVDAQHLEGNRPLAEPPDLLGRSGIKDPGQLRRLPVAAELHRHRSREADVLVATGGEPVQVVRPDDGYPPARPADSFHLGQSGRAAVPGGGGEG